MVCGTQGRKMALDITFDLGGKCFTVGEVFCVIQHFPITLSWAVYDETLKLPTTVARLRKSRRGCAEIELVTVK